MLFNSYEFILVFLPVSVVLFYLIARFGNEFARGFLVLASLFFYGWWNPAYLLLLLSSIVVNFFLGRRLGQRTLSSAARKPWLWVGIAFNLGLLGYYKYAEFFVENVALLTGIDWQIQAIVLPLAISFFTFQQIAYLVDAYRGISKEYAFLHYALFVTFFPQLIAGPIVHHKDMLPQFMQSARLRAHVGHITVGTLIFSIGLFKKAVLADGIAVYATPVFDQAAQGVAIGFFEAWGAALAYTLQLYFDFSGYSDMAIGAARLFGIKLPLNFHSPYKALNITEFWRRWHMTLSQFLRDYVYIALGGNRKGRVRRYINLGATMLLGGLWHGAGWTFVVWGALHGSYLVINHAWQYTRVRFGWHGVLGSRVGRTLAWSITFVAVVVGWVFFRAENLSAAWAILTAMGGQTWIGIPNGIAVHLGAGQAMLADWGVRFTLEGGRAFVGTWLWIALLLPVALFFPNTQQFMERFEPAFDRVREDSSQCLQVGSSLFGGLRFALTMRWAALSAVVSVSALITLNQISEFLYFQF